MANEATTPGSETPAPEATTANGAHGDSAEAPNAEARITESLSAFRKAGFDYDDKRVSEYANDPIRLLEELAGWIKKQRAGDEAPGLYKKRVRDNRPRAMEKKESPATPGSEVSASLPSEVMSYETILPAGRGR